MLLFAWSAFVVTCIDRYAWGTIAATVGQSLGLSIGSLGAFTTAFYTGYAIANVVGGPLADLIGGRAALSLALAALGSTAFCFGYVSTLEMGILIQFVMGLASGADYCAGVKLINGWFRQDKGRAIGIFASATSISIIAANLIVPALTARVGWTVAFQILGVATVFVGLLVLVGTRGVPPHIPRERLSHAHLVALIRNRDFLLLSVAGGAGVWGIIGFVSWANALLTKHFGLTLQQAGGVMTIVGAAAFVFTPLVGWLSDLIPQHRRKMIVAWPCAFAVMLAIFGRCDTASEFRIIAPFLGIFAYGYLPMLITQITTLAGPTSAGSAAGFSNALWQLIGAIAPLAVGFTFAQTHSFLVAVLVVAVGPVVAAFTLLFVRSIR